MKPGPPLDKAPPGQPLSGGFTTHQHERVRELRPAQGETKSESRATAADERTKLVKDLVAKENAAIDARTIRLKAERLAKEAATAVHLPAPSKRKDVSKEHRKIWKKLDRGPKASG